MIRVKTLVGVCAVCALAVSAVGAQTAFAGTTAFLCEKKAEPGGVGFSDAHCTSAVSTGAQFEHVAIPVNVEIEGLVTNERTASGTTASSPAKLEGTISGFEVALKATSTRAEAIGRNTENAKGEMFIQGTGRTTYTGVSVTKPEGIGCRVRENKVVTEELKGTSQGLGMEGELQPAGSKFASITIEGCSTAALNKTFPVTGSIRCPNNGATIVCTHSATTAQGTLIFGGQVAGVEVATTATTKTEPFVALAATTVP